MRIIMHVDFDSFYASMEEQRKPEIAGRPVVVCMFSGRGESGAVATANYKARELGIRAGMAIAFAKRAAPDGIFLPADLEYYREVSAKIMDIMEGYADSFQQVSIDEAYLDATSCGSFEAAKAKAAEIKKSVFGLFHITCSVGIAENKLVAKMASRFRKPDGLTIVRPEETVSFLSTMPVGKIHGIGGKTSKILEDLGVKTAGELASFSTGKLEEIFGKNKARMLQEKSKGIHDSPVTVQEAKQLSRMGTLDRDTLDFNEVYAKIEHLSKEMHKKITKNSVSFRTVSIILIDENIEMQTRSRTMPQTNKLEDILSSAKGLLDEYLKEGRKKIRRAGVRVSNLSYGEQPGLYKFFS